MATNPLLPITPENFPIITSSEVDTNDAIVMITQPNLLSGFVETYQIPLSDYFNLFDANTVNYETVRPVFSQTNSNIIFGEFVDPDTAKQQITLNFNTSHIENQIDDLTNADIATNTRITEEVQAITDDYNAQFVTVNSNITQLQRFALRDYYRKDEILVVTPTFTLNVTWNAYNYLLAYTFDTTQVNFSYNLIINLTKVVNTPVPFNFSNLLVFSLYGTPQSLVTTNTPNTVTLNLIRDGFPTQTYVKKSSLVVPSNVSGEYYASDVATVFYLNG